jgi:nicotinamidase-related amidase
MAANGFLLDRHASLLLIVDIQEKLAPVIHQVSRLVTNTVALLESAGELAVPILATEQFRRGLGGTVAPIVEFIATRNIPVLAKCSFNATAEPTIREALTASNRRDVVICGAEAHVCVLQTAMGLMGMGLRPIIVSDAVSSRKPTDREAALERLRAAGAGIVTTEMVIFEWLERANTADFRRLLPIIRALSS